MAKYIKGIDKFIEKGGQGHSRDHLQHIDVIVAEARKNGIEISFDGTDGEIVHLGDRTGKIGADECEECSNDRTNEKEEKNMEIENMYEIETFTEADVFANNENDILVDEGEFRENEGMKYFHSTLTGEDCECGNRAMHEQHLFDVVEPYAAEKEEKNVVQM